MVRVRRIHKASWTRVPMERCIISTRTIKTSRDVITAILYTDAPSMRGLSTCAYYETDKNDYTFSPLRFVSQHADEDGCTRVWRWPHSSPKMGIHKSENNYSSHKMDVLESEPEVRRGGVSKPCDVVIPGHVQLVGGAVAGTNHNPATDWRHRQNLRHGRNCKFNGYVLWTSDVVETVKFTVTFMSEVKSE